MLPPHHLIPGSHFCPAHDDHRSPSLSVAQAADGRWLIHCHAGCSPESILKAWGMAWADIFPEPARPRPWRKPTASPPAADPTDPELVAAFCRVLAQEDRHRARRAEWAPEMALSDRIRALRRRADLARRLAVPLGESAGAWALLEAAASYETQAEDLGGDG